MLDIDFFFLERNAWHGFKLLTIVFLCVKLLVIYIYIYIIMKLLVIELCEKNK